MEQLTDGAAAWSPSSPIKWRTPPSRRKVPKRRRTLAFRSFARTPRRTTREDGRLSHLRQSLHRIQGLGLVAASRSPLRRRRSRSAPNQGEEDTSPRRVRCRFSAHALCAFERYVTETATSGFKAFSLILNQLYGLTSSKRTSSSGAKTSPPPRASTSNPRFHKPFANKPPNSSNGSTKR